MTARCHCTSAKAADSPGSGGRGTPAVHREGLRRDHPGGGRRPGRRLEEHFLRFFRAKEAAAIEAEAELWSAYLDALSGSELSGEVLEVLHQTLAAAVATLEPSWDERFLATRRLVALEPALLGYLDHYRAGVKTS